MKSLKFLILFLFFSIILQIYPQSDFRITQEFKSRQRSFEIAIEYAKSQDELTKIEKEIEDFRNEFKGSKDLLNRALYPNNFQSSFAALEKKVEFTRKKLTEITSLKSNVTKLESDYAQISAELEKMTNEVIALRNTNQKLMLELSAFKSGYGGSKQSIDSLNNIVSQLKKGITQRDTLIKEIMDNIFLSADNKIQSLDDAERKNILAKIQKTSLIDNIRSLVDDNIKFLDASSLNNLDLAELKQQFNEFDSRWKHFGPKLFDIYSVDKNNKDKLLEIDSLITSWNTALNTSAWHSINNIFKEHNIQLQPFATGDEFESSVLSYISNQINPINDNAVIKSDQEYIYFAERVWQDKIKKDWLPFLFTNELISESQIKNIDLKLEEWKNSVSSSSSLIIYGIIILLALAILISLFLIFKKKGNNKKSNQNHLEYEIKRNEEPDEYINSGDDFLDDDDK